jgi:catechol 2,3-dioxygenase-like lactoylglutathione lyase family enzyme
MITDINHLTIAVTDISRSFAFYKDLLQFKPLVKWDKGAYFLVGSLWFCLNSDEKRKPHPCYTHYAFSVHPKNFEKMRERLIQNDVKIFQDNKSEGDSLYFLDPDDHKLEMHVGNWQSRLKTKKSNPGSWQNVEWFLED